MNPVGRRALLAGLGAGALGLALPGCAADVRRLRLAAGDDGGIYAAFGALLAPRLEARVDGLAVEVAVTAGSVDNLRRLADGDAGIGLALADSVGAGSGDPAEGVVALARTYENYLQLLVPADSSVRDVAGLRGRSVVLGAAGSGAAVSGGVLLEAAGLQTGGRGEGGRGAGVVDVRNAGLAASLVSLDDGSVDAVLWSGGIPTPAIAALDATRPLRMLDLGAWAEPMAEVSGYPYRSRRAPDVAYAGTVTSTIGVPNLLLARADLADDLAGAVVETLARDAAALVPDSARGVQYLAPPSMIQTGSVPLHPGAVAAYRRLHG